MEVAQLDRISSDYPASLDSRIFANQSLDLAYLPKHKFLKFPKESRLFGASITWL